MDKETKFVCENQNCGFDLGEFEAERIVTEGPEVALFCPVCGNRLAVPLGQLGIFYRGGAEPGFVQWKLSAERVAAATRVTIPLGKLNLRFDEKTCPLEPLRPQDICYPAVPAFRQLDGALAVPTLPVRVDFLDCIDLAVAFRPGEVVRGRYQAELPLHGLTSPLRIELPLMAAEPGKTVSNAERDVFRGVNIRLWPPVAFRKWKRFFVGIAAVDEDGRKIFHPQRTLEAHWVNHNLLATLVAAETAGKSARVACTTERPTCITLSFGERGRPVGGGLWQVSPATEEYGQGTLSLGVDFGTSNTCIAYAYQGSEPQSLPIASDQRNGGSAGYIVQSGREPEVHEAVDTWVPRLGFGPKGDLLASELLVNRPVRTEVPDPAAIKAWKPVERFSIPTAGVHIAYPERDYIISEFKWSEQVQPVQFQGDKVVEALQEVYLDFAAFFALGHILSRLGGVAAPGSVLIRYSYPLVFSTGQRSSLASVWKNVAQRLSEDAIGMHVEANDSDALDESNAAAQNGLGEFGETPARLFVDIGGGTTDLALLWRPKGRGEAPQVCYLTSFRYAGRTYIDALSGTGEKTVSCLVGGCSVEALRRLIRESSLIRNVINSPNVIKVERRTLVERRAALFYLYLVEYLARLIVAPLLSGEAPVDDGGERPDPWVVEVVPMGNGWGFAGILDPHGEEGLIVHRMQERVDQLLEELCTAGIKLPRIRIAPLRLKGLHPKAAVAHGVLKLDREGKNAAVGATMIRRIVGYTTTVNGKRKVPWYVSIEGNGQTAPDGQEKISTSAFLRWEADEMPQFPSGLPAPHSMDHELRHSSTQLVGRTAPRTEAHSWLCNSPFEILLEELFRRAVPNDGVPYAD